MESLVVLSDVHLGSDVGLPSEQPPARSEQIDEDLCRLIDHYCDTPPAGSNWRLVIAGDFIDFVGMTLPATDPTVQTEPDEEELLHGLGSAEDHAVRKMRAVAERHRDVFAALGRFVANGHTITVIRGNHDMELHWDAVRAELVQTIVDHARAWWEDESDFVGRFDAQQVAARIDHAPWFLNIEGVAYLEHGHQYDSFCSVDHVLAPRSPRDPRRTCRGFIDVLLRYVVKRTPGVPEHGHEAFGVLDYVRIGLRLGPTGLAVLLLRFARAIRELFRLRGDHTHAASKVLAAEHEERLSMLAEARRIGRDELRALCALQVAPITSTVRGILASLLLDQLALGVIGTLLVALFAWLSLSHSAFLAGVVAVIAGCVWTSLWLASQRKVDPDIELGLRAGALARIFSAPLVVMGHTHVPRRIELAAGATYVNLGSWSEHEGEQGATRTHLVVHVEEGCPPRAELRQWCSERGPMRYVIPVADSTGRHGARGALVRA